MKNGKWQRGDIGPDGRRFWSYKKSCRNGELWMDEDDFLIRDATRRLSDRMRGEDGSNALKNAAYRAANPEKEKARGAAYRAANPEKVNAKTARRRAAKIAATTENADHKIIATFYATAKRLSDVTGIPFEVDHIIPLIANGGGGKHCHTNLRVLPRTINIKRNSPAYVEPSCWAVPHPA